MSAKKKVTKPRKPNQRVLARRAAKMKHAEWSLAVRERDGHICQFPYCGVDKYVQGHHWYVGKRVCPALAHDTDNGITLCRYHHQVVMHKQGTYRLHAAIRTVMSRILGQDRMNALVKRASEFVLCPPIKG